jgi:hypothetical protein
LDNYENSRAADNITFHEEQDFYDFLVNTVDWTKDSGFFEELGIIYSNALGQLIIQLLKHSDVSPARLLEVLDNVLEKGMLEIMNEHETINEWTPYLNKRFLCDEEDLAQTIQFLAEKFLLV